MSTSFATLDGHPVVEAQIVMPRLGIWTATLVVDAGTDLPAEISTFAAPGLTLVGHVGRVGTYRDALRVELVGAGGLSSELPAKAYRNVPLRIPLTDALDGIAVAATSDASMLGHQLATWIRMSGTSRAEVGQLAEVVDAAWRVLPDGTLWLGAETWPVEGGDYEVLNETPERHRVEVWAESLTLRPGTTFLDRHVSTVIHTIRPSQIRTAVEFE